MPAIMAATRTTASIDAVFGDEVAFRDWYDRALPRVYRYLYHRCGRDVSLAEELTQDTFAEAVRSGRRTGTHPDAVAWVLGIARHRLADHFRRLARQERRLAQLAALPTPTEAPGQVWPDADLADALASLPAMQRAAVILRYVDDLPVREVAGQLGRSEKAVESLLSRGREALRRRYEGTES